VKQPTGTPATYEEVKIQVKLLNMSVIRQRSTCGSLWWKTWSVFSLGKNLRRLLKSCYLWRSTPICVTLL
jgi:hypothetical protein